MPRFNASTSGIIQGAFLLLAVTAAEFFAFKYYGGMLKNHFGGAGFSMPTDFRCFWINGAIAAHQLPASSPMTSNVSPFMYPPPFLLIAALLSLLPPLSSYILWLVVTNAGLALAGRLVRLPWTAIGLGLISPPNLYSIAIGQTGAFISALLLLGFGLARTNAATAGIAASLLIVKPQFFILVPICYLAARNWRALGAFSIGAAILCIIMHFTRHHIRPLRLAAFSFRPDGNSADRSEQTVAPGISGHHGLHVHYAAQPWRRA